MSTKTKGRVLPDLSAELKAKIKELEKANTELKAATKATIKVSTKGAVSIYGMGRFPTTLYKSQWEKLLGMAPEIKKFIKDHESELAVKE